jgi:hypothetical protein
LISEIKIAMHTAQPMLDHLTKASSRTRQENPSTTSGHYLERQLFLENPNVKYEL